MKRLLSCLLSLCILVCIGSASFSALSSPKATDETVSEAAFQTDMSTIEDCQVLQYVDDKPFKEANHTARLKSNEDLNTYVFQNNDGSKSVYYMDENVKFIDEEGTVKEKDISLISTKKGYKTTENDVQLDLPQNISDGVEINYSDCNIKITPKAAISEDTETKQTDNSIYKYF